MPAMFLFVELDWSIRSSLVFVHTVCNVGLFNTAIDDTAIMITNEMVSPYLAKLRNTMF